MVLYKGMTGYDNRYYNQGVPVNEYQDIRSNIMGRMQPGAAAQFPNQMPGQQQFNQVPPQQNFAPQQGFVQAPASQTQSFPPVQQAPMQQNMRPNQMPPQMMQNMRPQPASMQQGMPMQQGMRPAQMPMQQGMPMQPGFRQQVMPAGAMVAQGVSNAAQNFKQQVVSPLKQSIREIQARNRQAQMNNMQMQQNYQAMQQNQMYNMPQQMPVQQDFRKQQNFMPQQNLNQNNMNQQAMRPPQAPQAPAMAQQPASVPNANIAGVSPVNPYTQNAMPGVGMQQNPYAGQAAPNNSGNNKKKKNKKDKKNKNASQTQNIQMPYSGQAGQNPQSPFLEPGNTSDSKKYKQRKKKSFTKTLVIILIMVAIIFGLSWALREYVFQAYEIPSGSMEDTIKTGDMVFAEKVSKNFESPKAGQIVTFDDPKNEGRILIKRIIATGGQTVDIRNNKLYIDDEEANEPYTNKLPTTKLSSSKIQYPYVVPDGEV